MGSGYPGGIYFAQYSQGGSVPTDFFLPNVSIATTQDEVGVQSTAPVEGAIHETEDAF